jgi:hypothetical protein
MILMCLGMLRPTRSARRVSRGRTKLFSAARRLPYLLGTKIVGGVSLSEQRGVNLSERYSWHPPKLFWNYNFGDHQHW